VKNTFHNPKPDNWCVQMNFKTLDVTFSVVFYT
jgi:hypothetical protein